MRTSVGTPHATNVPMLSVATSLCTSLMSAFTDWPGVKSYQSNCARALLNSCLVRASRTVPHTIPLSALSIGKFAQRYPQMVRNDGVARLRRISPPAGTLIVVPSVPSPRESSSGEVSATMCEPGGTFFKSNCPRMLTVSDSMPSKSEIVACISGIMRRLSNATPRMRPGSCDRSCTAPPCASARRAIVAHSPHKTAAARLPARIGRPEQNGTASRQRTVFRRNEAAVRVNLDSAERVA